MTQTSPTWLRVKEPFRHVAALGAALTLTVATADLLLNDSLTFFFDVGFIAICVLVGLRIAHDDLGHGPLLAPALMFALIALLALVQPDAIADEQDPFFQAFVSGLAHHAIGFAVGYAACLALLRWRKLNERATD